MRFSFCFLVAGLLFPLSAFPQKTNILTPKEKKDGWILLFDGVSTKGWTTVDGKPVPGGWEVSNGVLTAKKDGKGGDIISTGAYSDFELSLDFNIEPGGNSGVKYLFTRYTQGGNLGMEYQILDDELAEDNQKDNHLTGSFYDVLAPDESGKKTNPPGQWNTIRVVARKKKVEHWLNGVKILEFTRGSQAYQEAVTLSKFSKAVPAFGMVEKGHILLQEHGSAVSFRNIKIKSL